LSGQKRFEFDFSDKTLYEAIDELSNKHKFKFSYNPEAIKAHELNRKIKANSEAELISKIFEDLPFKIQISDGVYLVIPEKIKPIARSLAGKVYDRETGKPLAFAHVQSAGKGTISNQEGRFKLPPREDTITLDVSYIGYKDLQLKVPPNAEDVSLDLELNPLILQEVILNTNQLGDLSGRPSFFSLNPKQFNALPTLGETDVFKSIQLLPGVQATDETASGLSVRGGTPSQNLVLMDGFTLYHLDHFFGIFSTLNPNVINNVSLYKGGFGPMYGGRVSSVVDVTGKSGSQDKFSAKAGINFLSFDGFLEAPIGSKSSILIGMRHSFTGILNSNLFKDFLSSNREAFLESISPDVASLQLKPSLKFYDINGKFQHQFNSNSQLSLNVYISEDDYSAEYAEDDDFSSYRVSDKAKWENGGVSLNWKYNINPGWYSNLTLGVSSYSDQEKLNIGQTFSQDVAFNTDSLKNETVNISRNEEIQLSNFGVQSSVNDLTFRSDHEIDIGNDDMISVGIEVNSISTNYDSDQFYLSNFVDEFVVNDTLTLKSNIISGYGAYQFQGTSIVSNIGLRGSYYEPANKWYIEPRFDINFRLNENINLKGAASFHHQFVNQTSLSFFDNDNKFYWVLADDESIPILKSTHLIFGGNYTNGNWTFDLEYYRKNTNGILENRFVSRSPAALAFIQNEQINLAGENISEGLDVFIKYRNETFTSWFSYTLGSSNNEFWYINQNNPYPSNQDQRHEFNLANILKVNQWELSNVVVFGSGRPYTIPVLENDSIIYFDDSKINDQRLPTYFRIDFSGKYSFSWGKAKCETGITLFNILDKRNVKSRRFTEQYLFDEQSDAITRDQVKLVALDTRLLGFTPNFFFNIRF
jgi:hypothetical protein